MGGILIDSFTATISAATISEGNSSVTAMGLGTNVYVRNMSQINFTATVTWSGMSYATDRCYIYINLTDKSTGTVYGAQSSTYGTGKSGTTTISGYFPESRSNSTGELSGIFQPGVAGNFTVTIGASGTSAPSPIGGTRYSNISTSANATRTLSDITYYNYQSPSINTFAVRRATSGGVAADEGTYLRCDVNAAITRLKGTENGTFVIQSSSNNGSSWSTVYSTSGVPSINYSNLSLSGTYPTTTSYLVRLTVSDPYNSTTASVTIPVGLAVFHLNKNKNGIGLGKYIPDYSPKTGAAWTNALDIGYDTLFEGNVDFMNPRYVRQTGLRFGGASAGILDESRSIVDTNVLLATYGYQVQLPNTPASYAYGSEYDPGIVVPVQVNGYSYNYVWQVQDSGYYNISVSIGMTSPGSTNTECDMSLRVYVVPSLAYVPTTTSSTYVWGISGSRITTGVPSSYYRYFTYYARAATTTSSGCVLSANCYMPSGYVVYPTMYVRTAVKMVSNGNIGIVRIS